ncbi:hypothetical protein OG921_04545 [Aldersonia sp. NBC_00410]|uniref:hypothetical protein n=1 Tax=Aldersonia sp. NBC_00410 TaxID=2975954 RepID=UPI00225B000D|nr:hypothetical protein [Aldersonia sp. NBC_00410]MCX5042443.1 hypothetical protein [Aldersonia sp. NBC_00410]
MILKRAFDQVTADRAVVRRFIRYQGGAGTAIDGQDGATAVSTAALYDRLRKVTKNEHGIYIEKVRGTDDEDRLIVYIGGMTSDFIGPNQPWSENLGAALWADPDEKLLAVLDEAVEANPGYRLSSSATVKAA